MPKRAPTRADHLRSAVAQEAARLMAEHGIQDYLVAKRKAAERYGVVDGSVLPKNTEIEAALVAYQRLFGGSSTRTASRSSGASRWRPCGCWRSSSRDWSARCCHGSATEFADIQLHVFSDSPEAVYMHLMDRRYEYEVFERKVKMQADRLIAVPSVRFEMGDETIEAFVFPKDGIRQAPVSPVDGKPMRRAGIGEVQGML